MHIAYVTETYPPQINGVALTVARTVRHLRDRGHSVQLVRPAQANSAGAKPNNDAHDDATLLTRGSPIPMYPELQFGWPATRRLLNAWRTRRPDLVHVATEGPLGSSAIRAARRLDIAVTSDFRTNFHQYSRHYRLAWAAPLVEAYLRRFHNRTDRTFAPTVATAVQLRAAGFERVHVAGRGVDTTQFSPAHRSEALRRQWGADRDTTVLLHVGRLAPEKNVSLVAAAAAVVDGFTPSRLVWIGDGPMRSQLQRDCPGAIFTGNLRGAELAAAYASADVFLFPSRTDTFGNVTLEALASGLVVAAYDTAAAAVHIRNRVSGMLAADETDDAFIAAAVAAGCRVVDREAMRRNARSAALAASWDHVLGQFEQALMAASEGARSPGAREFRLA